MSGIKIKVACAIAGVDRQQFNEAVSGGYYSCAPKTQPGSSRVFNAIDMLPLMVFGRLLRAGEKVPKAGCLAVAAHAALREHAFGFSGAADWQVGAVLDRWPALVFEFAGGGLGRATFFSPKCSLQGDLRFGPNCQHVMAFDARQLFADYLTARAAWDAVP